MGLKKLPSRKLYWSRDDALYKCPLIFQYMTEDRYELITLCLHVANAPPNVQDSSSPTYDNLHKVRWIIDEVCTRFRSMWFPNQQMIVDEGMNMYKGRYCPIRKYMAKEPIKFDLKFWAAIDTVSKYMWDFEVY